MSHVTNILSALLFFSIAGAAYGQESGSETDRIEVPKVEREGIWQPTQGGTQVPLWPKQVRQWLENIGML